MVKNAQKLVVKEDLPKTVKDIVRKTKVLDIHTHIYDTGFGPLLLWGVDELVTYHYLVAEVFRQAPMPYDDFWALSKQAQADLIWQKLFIEHSPISEACRGILTTLNAFGCDVGKGDLGKIRKWFASRTVEQHIDQVFELAGVRGVVMTNDPFDAEERPCWDGRPRDPRFKAALRVDFLLNSWPEAAKKLVEWGYEVDETVNAKTVKEVRRFLGDWVNKISPVYMAASLPPSFKFPEKSARAKLISDCVLTVGKDRNLPFAMMIGAKKLVNPGLRLAGDSVGRSSTESVESLCEQFPDNKFLLTILAREDQHAACVVTRKFHNLHLFGCWWFLNNPSIIEEMTRMRIEMLGLSFTAQHSDARVLDQLVYKWAHSREVIAKVLIDKYQDLLKTGWHITEDQIRRDVSDLLGGSFEAFLAR